MTNGEPKAHSSGTKSDMTDAIDLSLSAVDIPPRLSFLIQLRGRPAFEGSAMLDMIISDYRRALAAARREQNSKRGRQ